MNIVLLSGVIMTHSFMILTCHECCENRTSEEVTLLFTKLDDPSDSVACSAFVVCLPRLCFEGQQSPFWDLTLMEFLGTAHKVNDMAQLFFV